MRVVHDPPEDTWRDFLDRQPAPSVFHTVEMARVFADALRHKPKTMASMVDGNMTALFTPVEIRVLGPPFGAATARSVAFATPLAEDVSDLAAVLAAYTATRRRAGLFTEIRHTTDPDSIAPVLAGAGFEREPHLNFLVDLTIGPELLWRGLSSTARRNVRRARESGVDLRRARDEQDVLLGYEVLEDVYRRIRVPLPDLSLFAGALRHLGPSGMFSMVLAEHRGRTVGALCLLAYRGAVTYWYTGASRDNPSLRVADLLMWEAIETSATTGHVVFDLGGAGRPDEPYGVRDFKAKFGGELVAFGRDLWVPSPTRLALATRGYELARRFL
jgi:serine/alanine adding enzyme